MTEFIVFQICKERLAGHSAFVPEPQFGRLVQHVNKYRLTRTPVQDSATTIPINCAPNADGLVELFDQLAATGWRPKFDESGGEGVFRVRRVRHYDESDLDNARLLYLVGTIGDWPLSGFVGRNGERWIASSSRVGYHSGKGWTQEYGSIDGLYNYFVSSRIRRELEARNLARLRFYPLEWDVPAIAKKEFWELSSDSAMPPCLTPIRIVDNFTLFAFYDEQDYYPVELSYRASDIASMGDFDIALGHERIGFGEGSNTGSRANSGRHVIVVSQAMRSAFASLSIPARYALVNVVSD